ncbi:sigma-70 family RNA polymerase sigma factor [Paenibacillus polymyxa]|uniref:sigma-70 family RNA polymerase sigma factor n=1 Tax=Paenibacillus polymyxa TaxID=1406 RepID=UPI00202515E8|nr:sigma-70 family RNA polymerase sigma factor [Paenibacillus polymyxa]URJ60922.1 sigma-70 family RNA polymerase sigma factor [Paenibacillus polymyxa]
MGAIEQYRRELYRIAWRMQYREKRDRKREVSMECSPDLFQPSFSEESDNKVMLQSYINKLVCEASKKVIYEIYINDKTEVQVARELKITQQAVNKWKKKALRELCQMMSL